MYLDSVDFTRFSFEMSSIITSVPRCSLSSPRSGRTVTFTDAVSSPTRSSASMTSSGWSCSATRCIRSRSHRFSSPNTSADEVPTTSSASRRRMRAPEALQVCTSPSSSNVTTPFDMLWSIDSL